MPDIARWLGSTSAAQAEIRTVFETGGAIACIIECDNQPVGYAHAIDAAHWGEGLPDGVPIGAWDIDVFIATKKHRGRGVGGAAVNLLADEVFKTTFALALSVIVPVRNEQAIRAFEKADFKWVRVWNDPIFGASWLLLRERPR